MAARRATSCKWASSKTKTSSGHRDDPATGKWRVLRRDPAFRNRDRRRVLFQESLITENDPPPDYQWLLKAANLEVSSDGSMMNGPWASGYYGGIISLVDDPAKPPDGGSTTTALEVGSQTPVYGQPVTLQAFVNPATQASGTPTGQVTFLDGPNALGTAPLSAGSATFTANDLSAGTHGITAIYGGVAPFSGSSSPATPVTIAPQGTVVDLVSSSKPIDLGDSRHIHGENHPDRSRSRSSSRHRPLQRRFDHAWFGYPSSGGSASFTTSSLQAGPHNIVATFSGDANSLGSTGKLQEQVESASTPA